MHRTESSVASLFWRNGLTAVAITVIGLMMAAGMAVTGAALQSRAGFPGSDIAGSGAQSAVPAHRLVAVAVSLPKSASPSEGPTNAGPSGTAADRSAGAQQATVPSTPARSPGSPASPTATAPTPPQTSTTPVSTTPVSTTPVSTTQPTPTDGAYLDTGAAVAAHPSEGPAAPAFDKAMLGLSAQERSVGQSEQARQSAKEDARLHQDQRVEGQASAAQDITAEQNRLVEEKKRAEAAAAEAARKKAEAALAAAAARAAADQAPQAPLGTLLRTAAATSTAKASPVAPGTTLTPVAPGSYTIAARFGDVGPWASYHTGLDFAAPIGTPVRAAASGVVQLSVAGAWAGTHVIIAHADGSTLYAHLMTATVTPGQSVQAGDVIGFVGMTGHTFGPHLHFEYYPVGVSLLTPYTATDPAVWLSLHGVQV